MQVSRDRHEPASVDAVPYDPAVSPALEAAAAQPTRIAFFGNFGMQNLGNEYTLAAILRNARRRLPKAELSCICTDPEDASARHGVRASLVSYRYSREYISRWQSRTGNPVVRLLRRVFVRLPLEAMEWARASRALRGVTLLVMTGTGMLGDLGIGPLDLHYEILKWSALAKLRGTKVMFVSVGAGTIAHPLSRWIVKLALSLADYRSYRDAFSRSYLKEIGFDSDGDAVYPDLAFSLPPQVRGAGGGDGRVVAVGLMDYYGSRASPRAGEPAYLDYLSRMTKLVAWLLEHDYRVRLLVGDLSYDTRSVGDVLRMLRESGTTPREGQIVAAPIASAEQLVEEIARTDIVVATRFHNVLLGLMLKRPVVAISYHPKIASLMEAMDLSQYCQDIEHLDVAGLIRQFSELERNRSTVQALIERKTAECRRALDEQYDAVFERR